MGTQTIIEIIGYVGSGLVLISFLMSSVVKLRIVNTIGSLIFAIYALIIRSYPTAVMNVALVCINLYFLWKLRHRDSSYRMLNMRAGEAYVTDFLSSHREDIAKFFPERPEVSEDDEVFMVFHGQEPAGVLIGSGSEGVFDVKLDYSTPAYRDCSVGKYLIQNLERPLKLRYSGAEEAHIPYLKKLGFAERDGVWEKEL